VEPVNQAVAIDSMVPSSRTDRVLNRERAEPVSDGRDRVPSIESSVDLTENLGRNLTAERALRALVRPLRLTAGEELVERDCLGG
jgi:hypothetical protein